MAARREPNPSKNTQAKQPKLRPTAGAALAVGKTLMHGCPLILWEDDASEPVLIQDHLGPTDDKAYLEAYKYKKLKQGEDPVQRVLYEHSLTYQGFSYNKQD